MMRRMLVLSLAALLLSTSQAHARRESSYRYPFSLVWTTVVRMVRVDYESPITEKDKDEGYFLFEFPHDGKEHSGSIEVIRQTDDSGAESVRVIAKIASLPSYFEQMLLDRLERKLAKEHGQPLERPSEPKKPTEPKGDEDAPSEPDKPNDSEK